MRLLIPLALVLFGAVTGLICRSFVKWLTKRRRGGSPRVAALAAGGGAIAGLWVRDVLDVTDGDPLGASLLAALAGAALVGTLVSLASPGRRRRR